VVYYLAKKKKGNEWIWVGVTFLVSSLISFWVSIIPIVYLLFSEKKEIKLLRGQAKQGDTDAQYNLGVYLMNKNSYEEAQNWFDKAATQGHTDAQSKSDECRIKIEEEKAAAERRAAERAAEKEAAAAAEKARIIESLPQYHIYLNAVYALEQSGYEIENTVFKKGLIQSYVKQGDIKYGMIFTVKYPSQTETLLENRSEDGSLLSGHYYAMVQVCRNVNKSRYAHRVYWPEGSLVGGFTQTSGFYQYEDRWLNILASVIG
jgi:TPR repeat protein